MVGEIKTLDERKNKLLETSGIFLIRIKESDRDYFDSQNNILYFIWVQLF